MRGGGYNAENSQISDGRRAVLRKCRDCENSVRSRGARLCSDCSQRVFECKQLDSRARAAGRPLPQRDRRQPAPSGPVEALSWGLAGLQSLWLATVSEAHAIITRSAA